MPDDPTALAVQASRCRRLARTCGDARTSDALEELAGEYDRRRAQALNGGAEADEPWARSPRGDVRCGFERPGSRQN